MFYFGFGGLVILMVGFAGIVLGVPIGLVTLYVMLLFRTKKSTFIQRVNWFVPCFGFGFVVGSIYTAYGITGHAGKGVKFHGQEIDAFLNFKMLGIAAVATIVVGHTLLYLRHKYFPAPATEEAVASEGDIDTGNA